jgi:FixJ family two-component response regulator
MHVFSKIPGPEFLKSLDTGLPDCVVLDLHMPHMNGFHVQAHLARKYAALPVIIFTGHDLPKARERALAGGASAFLRKPVHDRILLGAISAATASAQQGAPNGHMKFFQNFAPQFPEKEVRNCLPLRCPAFSRGEVCFRPSVV